MSPPFWVFHKFVMTFVMTSLIALGAFVGKLVGVVGALKMILPISIGLIPSKSGRSFKISKLYFLS